KREEMMVSERVEVDVLDDHHLVVIDGEQRVVQDFIDICLVPGRQEAQRLLDARGSTNEPLTIRIFTELDQEPPDQILHLRIVQRRFSRSSQARQVDRTK